MNPTEVGRLRPGTWIIFTGASGTEYQGQIVPASTEAPTLIRIEWADEKGEWNARYRPTDTLWRYTRRHPDYPADESDESDLSVTIRVLLDQHGISNSVIDRILSLVAFGEAQKIEEARWIDALANHEAGQ